MVPSKKVLVFLTVPPSSSKHFSHITRTHQDLSEKPHNTASSSQTSQAGFVSISHLHIAVWVACGGGCVRIYACVCVWTSQVKMHPSSRPPTSALRRFVSERTCWYPPLSLSVYVHGHMVDPPPIGSCRQKTAIHTPIQSSC